MRVQRHLSIAVPIPPSLPASLVVQVLQTVSPVIRNLGTLSRYEETTAGSDPVANDPFFLGGSPAAVPSSSSSSSSPATTAAPDSPPDGLPPVTSYQIFEVITLAPGLTKEVTYPAYFQRVGDGIRCRANGAAGITGWCEFVVRPRASASAAAAAGSSPASPEGSSSTPSTFGGDAPSVYPSASAEYEIHEAIVVEANSLLMPFVCHTMQVAHRGLCDKVIQEAADKYSQSGWDYR